MIILPILTTSPIHFSSKGWENVLLELGSERVKLPKGKGGGGDVPQHLRRRLFAAYLENTLQSARRAFLKAHGLLYHSLALLALHLAAKYELASTAGPLSSADHCGTPVAAQRRAIVHTVSVPETNAPSRTWNSPLCVRLTIVWGLIHINHVVGVGISTTFAVSKFDECGRAGLFSQFDLDGRVVPVCQCACNQLHGGDASPAGLHVAGAGHAVTLAVLYHRVSYDLQLEGKLAYFESVQWTDAKAKGEDRGVSQGAGEGECKSKGGGGVEGEDEGKGEDRGVSQCAGKGEGEGKSEGRAEDENEGKGVDRGDSQCAGEGEGGVKGEDEGKGVDRGDGQCAGKGEGESKIEGGGGARVRTRERARIGRWPLCGRGREKWPGRERLKEQEQDMLLGREQWWESESHNNARGQ